MNKEKRVKKFEILVSGRVQGVGFRYYTLQRAIAHGIKGYVQNTFEGKVKIVAIAENTIVENFLQDIQRGPRMSIVENLDIVELVTTRNYKDFRIQY